MSIDFRRLIAELRSLVAALEERCTAAEAREASLRNELERAQAHGDETEAQLRAVTARYENLQAGLRADGHALLDGGAAGCGEAVEAAVRAQRDRYLALVREIDDCIARLERRV